MDIEIKKFDDCCYSVVVRDGGEIVDTGIWCPVSNILAIGDDQMMIFDQSRM